MALKRQTSNTIVLLAILAGFLGLGGLLLLSPAEFHLVCQKQQCHYSASPVIGPTINDQFAPMDISAVTVHETHSKSGYSYHVYIDEKGKHLKVNTFGHSKDADSLVARIKNFLKAPTDIPMDIHYDNRQGMLLALSIAGIAVLFGLAIAGLKGRKIMPVQIKIKTTIKVNKNQHGL